MIYNAAVIKITADEASGSAICSVLSCNEGDKASIR